jgi:hypothetical protein
MVFQFTSNLNTFTAITEDIRQQNLQIYDYPTDTLINRNKILC